MRSRGNRLPTYPTTFLEIEVFGPLQVARYNDPAPRWREALVRALGLLGAREHTELLVQILEDERSVPGVRYAAAQALADLMARGEMAVLPLTGAATADEFVMEFVTVGHAGNAADATGYGAVDSVYRIGKYEVTAGQYSVFLNAVATTDTGCTTPGQAAYRASGRPILDTLGGRVVQGGVPYGTFDQGGNVWGWNEAVIGRCRGLRGGSFARNGPGSVGCLHASVRYSTGVPTNENADVGFRVASTGGTLEPATRSTAVRSWLATACGPCNARIRYPRLDMGIRFGR